MKNKTIVFTAVLLVIAIGNYSRITSHETIRTVTFLSVFSMGALAGVLITQIFKTFRDR